MGKSIRFDEDGLPIPDTVKVSKSSVQFDDEGLPVPVKKKVSFGGIVGTYAPQSEDEKMMKALQTVKSSPATEGDVVREAKYKAVTSPKLQVTQEEFDEDPVSVSRKVILSKMPSVKRYDQPKSAEQEDKVAEFSFKEGDKEIENVKKFYSDNTNGSIAHLSKITGITNPDLFYSDEFDERIKSAVKPGNETDRLAYERLQDAKKARAVVRENLEQGKSFEDMAIDYAAANSPEMAKVIQQLKTTPTVDEVMGGVTSVNRRPEEAFDEATIGRFLYDFYNSSAIRQEMEKIPGMTSKVVSGANQLIQKYPSFGKMYLGNLISQKMEDMDMNNAVLNVATKKERDKAVEALVAEDKMSPLEVQFYKDNIRNLSGLGLLRRKVTGNPIIDTPGAFESAAGGAYGGFKNTIGGLYELTGLRESVLGSQGALRQDLEKTNTQVSIKPKGIVNQIAMNAGQFFGQSMSIGAGGKMINNIKLAKDPMTVMGMVGATQAYANYLPQARMMFPGNELKQKAYAFILSGIEWKTEKIFNDRKVVDGLLGKLKPSVVETIKDFTEKKISSEAARANIQSAIRRALKDTPEAAKYFGKAVVQNDIEELSAELGGQVSRGIFENKPFDEWIDGEDLYETTKAATLGSPIIGSLSARADMQKNRGITAKTIYSMAQDPDYWKSQIMEGAKLDETLAAEAPDKIKNLETAAKIVQELDATDLTEKQKVKFVITELEKQLKAEQSKDAAVQAIPKAAISELEKVQQDILDGKDDGSIEGDKSDDLTPDETKAVKLAAKEGLPGMYGEIDPLDALQEISYQAQGIKVDEDGNAVKLEGGGRVEDLKRMGVSQELIDAAVKAFPNPPIDQQREPVMGDEGLRGEEKSKVEEGSVGVEGENSLSEGSNKILGLHDNGVSFDLFDNNKLREIAKENGIDLPEGAKNSDIIEALKNKRNEATAKGLENLSEKDFDKLTPSQKVALYKEHGITKDDGSPITEKDIESNPLQYSYDFMASSDSGKWNSANSELESAVQGNRKQYSLYKLMNGEFDTFKEFVDFINSKNYGDKIEYTERMKRADDMSPAERKSAVDSYNKSVEDKAGDKSQKEKDILDEHGLKDETEYSPHELVEKFPLKGVQKVIWDIISPIVKKLGIKVKFSSSRITEGFDGSSNPMNGEVLLRPSTLKNGRLGEVLVHEVVHSLTTKIISRVNSGVETGLTSKQVAAVKGLGKLYKSIEADNNLQNKYPVKDIFEFIAHLTNDTFVKELQSKDRNFIQKVVDFISDILGLSDANELAKKYLKDIIHDGTFLEKEGITVVSSDYAANVKGAEGLTPKQRLLEAIKNNSKTTAEKYHDLKSKGKENDFTKAVEQSLKEQPASSQPLTEVEGGQTVAKDVEPYDGKISQQSEKIRIEFGNIGLAKANNSIESLIDANNSAKYRFDQYSEQGRMAFEKAEKQNEKLEQIKKEGYNTLWEWANEQSPSPTQEATKAPQSIKEELDAQKGMDIKNAMRPVLFPIAGREDISKISSEDALDRAKGLREEWNKLKQIIDCIWKMK